MMSFLGKMPPYFQNIVNGPPSHIQYVRDFSSEIPGSIDEKHCQNLLKSILYGGHGVRTQGEIREHEIGLAYTIISSGMDMIVDHKDLRVSDLFLSVGPLVDSALLAGGKVSLPELKRSLAWYFMHGSSPPPSCTSIDFPMPKSIILMHPLAVQLTVNLRRLPTQLELYEAMEILE